MPVAYEMRFKGATLDQYDEVIRLMGLTPGGSVPPGALFHWVAKTDDGLLVVDVWQDEETFERFSREQIGPYSQQAGFAEAPEITKHEVHTYLTAGSA